MTIVALVKRIRLAKERIKKIPNLPFGEDTSVLTSEGQFRLFVGLYNAFAAISVISVVVPVLTDCNKAVPVLFGVFVSRKTGGETGVLRGLLLAVDWNFAQGAHDARFGTKHIVATQLVDIGVIFGRVRTADASQVLGRH